jgi:2-polyprenyl-3-methyl-5-hydroxy-6-metoxy-1,4-benzoquinol methylase
MKSINSLNKNAENQSGVRPDLSYPNRMDQMRYFEALQYCKEKIVLDIACGVGWGTYLLSKAGSKFVYGVDISDSAILDATKFYSQCNIEYLVSNSDQIPLGDETVDVIVCLETLEHVSNPQHFFYELSRVLREKGILILSSPNAVLYKTNLKPYNPYHYEEYTKDEICEFANNSRFILTSYSGQYLVKEQTEINFYRRFIRNYWFIRRIQMKLGLIGRLISLFLFKYLKKNLNISDPALEGNCSPQIVEIGSIPAHHYFIFKKNI